ncbi:MAG TPA: HD domain-containing phosphohydrolase [Candidatus Binatia bacterium]|nr:HD domain-containing phosphohydrolase [Candidatus Binatia bacterium]
MAIVELSPPGSTSAAVLVHPGGLELGDAKTLLAEAGIDARVARFPYQPDTPQAAARVVYLIDYDRLASLGPHDDIEHALELMASFGSCGTILVTEPNDERASWLANNPHLVGWLGSPLDANAILTTVRAAIAFAQARDRLEQLTELTEEQSKDTDQLLEIGLALSAERDIAALQRLIVRKARELTAADAGSLFLVINENDEKKLRFAVAQTGPADEGVLIGALLPLSRASISGYVAVSGEVVRIDDAYQLGEEHEYRFNPSFDQKNNYRTKSVLCVPMLNHENEIVGVIQLINSKPDFETVLQSPAHTEEIVSPFSDHDEHVLRSLASQAAVALENKALIESIQDLFEQFVRASVKAIEARDPATQGHSSRVASLTVAQAEALNTVNAGDFKDLKFNADQLREMRYASLLHDFGKVAVPEYIFGKSKKLPDGRLDVIRMRFLLAVEQLRVQTAHRKLELLKNGAPLDHPDVLAIDAETATATNELMTLMKTVEDANEPRVVAEGVGDILDSLLQKHYIDVDAEKPMLDAPEYDFLKIPRGSLSNDERDKMQQHVTQSFFFLREIPWIKTPWKNVAEQAYGHHEHLDGTGYPRGLKSAEIVPQVRIMTISDIFDALTASDRPYKKAMSIEKALDILVKEFAERGKVDAGLLDLFIAKKVYEGIIKPAA